MQGLPGRDWYKNLIYAPGRFTGYGAKTLARRARSDRGRALGTTPPNISG